MKVSKNFYLHEFIDPKIYAIWGDKSLMFLDNTLFDIAQFVRNRYNKIVIINGEIFNKTYTESGLRRFNTRTGAKMSPHKFGRAIDLKWEGMNSDEIREDIRKNQELFYEAGLRRVEIKTRMWMHLDCVETNWKRNKITFF